MKSCKRCKIDLKGWYVNMFEDGILENYCEECARVKNWARGQVIE